DLYRSIGFCKHVATGPQGVANKQHEPLGDDLVKDPDRQWSKRESNDRKAHDLCRTEVVLRCHQQVNQRHEPESGHQDEELGDGEVTSHPILYGRYLCWDNGRSHATFLTTDFAVMTFMSWPPTLVSAPVAWPARTSCIIAPVVLRRSENIAIPTRIEMNGLVPTWSGRVRNDEASWIMTTW